MPKFAANLTMLFNEVDFVSRFEAASKAGFTGVEYLFPYDFDKNLLAEQLDKFKLKQVLHNLPAGNWAGGERGIACLPDRVGEFQDGVGRAIEYAKALGCEQVNVLAGITPQGVDADKVRDTFVSNIKFAADKLKAEGIKLLIEAINTFDIPGFYVSGTKQTLDLIAASGSDNIFYQYDIYHMQRMEGELANTIKANLPKIAHLQLADNPGRFEPGTGEINYPFLFSFLDEIGYTGWIGCEYKPKAGTVEGLGWVKPYLA
ncbi:hydroxypyruvate isomerase [Crenobacter sp. SG2303]|uniref:Hydroxypyruvate isomerase n=1 Tax=Crenobacter oryzisoli TaxID=3056844 RepID=A0ABT7XJI6_9NEIS|nr:MULTISPECIES: hydroxypyruvate isomerase [unclassified Crenobacter]MDN0073951.1 hydroxypyruvate isomerase [Crenobacter sp. SG2303]MDN0083530.1 hydroxypyruvate isomerase [Crenobacter sp. SG2305]